MNTRTSDKTIEYYLSAPKPEYESKGQEMIGQMLDEYHIAFDYKEPYLVWENGDRRIRRPDFTLLTYNNVVINYIPRLNQVTERIKDIYRDNWIAALFLDDPFLAKPDWQQRLYNELEKIFHQGLVYLANSDSEDRF
jgi:hypothetical protein